MISETPTAACRGFDGVVLSVMLLRRGQVITVTGKASYWQGY
ncbi:hypothetical protein [Xenorhabdus koppenhoeferi]|nr:hypothetical protein [Xenorhabdus sp. Vera]